MDYRISFNNDQDALIDAPDWLAALSQACQRFGVNPDELEQWAVTRSGEHIYVTDSRGYSFAIKPKAPALKVMPMGGNLDDEEEDQDVYKESKTLPFMPGVTPTLSMPTKARIKPVSALDLMEELFEITEELTSLRPEEVADRAVEHAMRLVGGERSGLYRGNVNDQGLKLIAAMGDYHVDAVGLRTDFELGAAGRCFQQRGTVEVTSPTEADLAHLEPGGRSSVETMLLTALVDEAGGIHGVLELVNVDLPLKPSRISAFESLAHIVANRYR